MTNIELVKCLRALADCKSTNCTDCPIPEISDGRRMCTQAESIWRLAADRIEDMCAGHEKLMELERMYQEMYEVYSKMSEVFKNGS